MSAIRPKLLLLLAAASVLVAWVAFSGCSAEVSVGGGDSEASGEEIAEKVREDYAEKTGGITLDRLTCEGVKAEVGARFECSGRNSHGVQVEITGKVTDTSSGGFDYSWHVSKAVAPGVLYERALRREVEEHGVTLSEVRCPVQIEVKVGEKVHCEAADASGEVRDVTLTLTDLDGGFDFTVAGGPSEPESTGATESSSS